jgi:hypothetical protein
VAYEANNGSANAVQPTEDGGVRMLTIIDNPNAPTAYDYKVTVPNGGRIELTPDGGAIVLDSASQPIVTVAAPWAKDAVGTAVNTWFTTDGQALTQHVQHNVEGVVYPVTADPFWIPMIGYAAAGVIVKRALIGCGLGWLSGAAQQIFFNGWVWREITKAGKQGCVWGALSGPFKPFFQKFIKF